MDERIEELEAQVARIDRRLLDIEHRLNVMHRTFATYAQHQFDPRRGS